MRQIPATVSCIIKVVQSQGWPPCAGGKDNVSIDKGLENLVFIYLGHSLMQIVSAALHLNFAGLKLEVRSGLTEFDSVINVYCSKAPANND